MGGVDEGACRSAGMGDEWVSWFAGVMCGWVVGDVGGCGNGCGWDGMCFRWVCGCEWSAGVGDVSESEVESAEQVRLLVY